VHEHNKEHGAVEYDHVAEDLGKLTVFLEQWQCGVDEEGDKLNQLHGRQVSFPPEIFLKSWSKCGQEVVEVHDYVNTHVQKSTECCVPPPTNLIPHHAVNGIIP